MRCVWCALFRSSGVTEAELKKEEAVAGAGSGAGAGAGKASSTDVDVLIEDGRPRSRSRSRSRSRTASIFTVCDLPRPTLVYAGIRRAHTWSFRLLPKLTPTSTRQSCAYSG